MLAPALKSIQLYKFFSTTLIAIKNDVIFLLGMYVWILSNTIQICMGEDYTLIIGGVD